jgi:hypothetical protein
MYFTEIRYKDVDWILLAQDWNQRRTFVNTIMKITVFWVVVPCSLVEVYLVNFYQTTRRCNPEDSHLRIHRRENLKSYDNETYCAIKGGEFHC